MTNAVLPLAPTRKFVAAPGRQRRGVGRWVVLAVLLFLLLATLFPFFLAFANAFKSAVDYAANGPLTLPKALDFTALIRFWNLADFGRKLFNSAFISICVAICAVLLSLLNAYAIGIGKVRGGRYILVALLLGIMVPQESIIYPIYYASKALGLYNTMTLVIIVLSVLQSAFGTYLLASVMSTFPREIIEAAEIDGANRWQILWFIIVPVLRPTLMVLATFFFIWTWNEFLLPLVLLISNDIQTVSVAMGLLTGQNTSDPTSIAAGSLLGIAPTLIFFLIFQRTLTRGIVVGSVK